MTDPLAKALSEHPREDAMKLQVLCPDQYHLLAAVYDLPGSGGLVLCAPHMKARRGSVFRLRPGQDPDELIHWHPLLERLGRFGDESMRGRCRCGTWHYKPADALTEVELVRAGEWHGIDPETFVRVRDDRTGQITRQPREYVERYLLPEGGHTIVGRAPGSERLRRPYMLTSYVGMADTPR